MIQIHCELISVTQLDDRFHSFCEQLSGVNPASVVQGGKRPRAKMAYPLAYFKAFINPEGDTSDVQALLGMMHFGMLCAGAEIDMAEVTGWPHGLRCLQGPLSRRGVVGIIVTGDGEQWATAIRNAGSGPPTVQAWGHSCYQQFQRHSLDGLFGKLRPGRAGPTGQGGYFLDTI
jgi:hypothetical protein